MAINEGIFNRLIEIEGEAANMIFEAQMEADDKIANVKRRVDSEYEASYAEVIGQLDVDFARQKKEVDLSVQEALDMYRAELKAVSVDYNAFAKIIDSYLFSKA